MGACTGGLQSARSSCWRASRPGSVFSRCHTGSLKLAVVRVRHRNEKAQQISPVPFPTPHPGQVLKLISQHTTGWGWAGVWGQVIFTKRKYMPSTDSTILSSMVAGQVTVQEPLLQGCRTSAKAPKESTKAHLSFSLRCKRLELLFSTPGCLWNQLS